MNVNCATVLILSSDPAFARQVTSNWPEATDAPAFVVLKEDLCAELRSDSCDLAIADGSSNAAAILESLTSIGEPAILLHSDPALPRNAVRGRVVLLDRESDNWAAVAGLFGHEILVRQQAERRARHAEQARAIAEGEATLGRYMVEMRHTVSNALTSVLGNVELLLHEPGLPASVLGQADTVRNMALRLNEVFQRFASIEKELSVAAREAGKRVETATSPIQSRGATAR